MKNLYIALENIRSLYNVGAILRTCSFYCIKNVILIGISGTTTSYYDKKLILNQKLHKTALGSENDLEITMIPNTNALIKFAKNNKLEIVCIEQDKESIPLQTWKPQSKSIIVFGHERNGVDKSLLEKANTIVEIPKKGIHPSLNVATTCGIIVNHIVNNYKITLPKISPHT